MVITKKINIKINSKTLFHYKKYFDDIKPDDMVIIDYDMLPLGSHQSIELRCDNCEAEYKTEYRKYVKRKDILDFCKKCVFLKSRKTMKELYGHEHALQSLQILKSMQKNVKEKYGVDNVSKLEDIKEKKKITTKTNHGVESPQQSEIIRDKTINTNIERYGTQTPLLNENILLKTKLTLNSKWNVDNIFQNEKIKNIISDKVTIINEKKAFEKYSNLNIFDVDNINKVYNMSCLKNHQYQISFDLLRNRRRTLNNDNICTICNPLNKNRHSENMLIEFIKDNYDGEIKVNNRKYLDGFELDIYLPDLNLAFELNGLYWHSEIFKDKKYHLNKTLISLEKNIRLIHIWEDDWLYKTEIVKSIILNSLGKSKKIAARKCVVREISNSEYRKFIVDNHLQGFVASKVKLGLYYDNELVSMMSLGGYRINMNRKSVEGGYELLRFCCKIGYSVIGGANKLFQHFIKQYDPLEVLTYADRSRYTGSVYLKMGFNFLEATSPSYFYIVKGKRENRFKYRKNVLVEQGYDSSKSEHQIMLERNIYRIYDCGTLKFKYTKT